MVDRESRSDLANCLHRLISGEMTNDEFDAAYYERWHGSTDVAVAEIAGFGYGLYSSDLLWPYRLRGRNAVSDRECETAQHALLFLKTELEYEWPINVKGVVPYWCLWGPGCYLLFGLFLLFVAYLQGGFLGLVYGVFGLVAVMPTFHWLITRRRRTEELEHFYKSGDFQVWPFLRKVDFDEAKRQSQDDA